MVLIGIDIHINVLEQDCGNSIANRIVLTQPCGKMKWNHVFLMTITLSKYQ